MSHRKGPDEVFGPLFHAVQSQQLYSDSKTFADATPLRDAALILADFRCVDAGSPDALRDFVVENFALPPDYYAVEEIATSLPIRERIEQLWDVLSRDPDDAVSGSSLIPLPQPYIVPGGRFREIYYWDSYFTMLGLAESGRVPAVENLVQNFAYLIDEIGFVPNGNRSYFCTRSQPPFFALMVELLAELKSDCTVLQEYLPQLQREYDFWMHGPSGSRTLAVGDAQLNRYWDDSDAPRAESYREDLELAAPRYRDLRAACESGWDFSSRWFATVDSLESIRTTDILPVDLNALLYRLESTLARGYVEAGDAVSGALFAGRAAQRRELLQTLFFDTESGMFVDILYPEMKPTGALSLAAVVPLFLQIATKEQAASVADRLRQDFLAAGGWLTTLQNSGQQWDRPNGWAPLQWMVFEGLRNYGFDDDADRGARRWVEINLVVYERTGRLLEKYDVENTAALATGGEYAVQDGFGWTNAVLLKFMNHLAASR